MKTWEKSRNSYLNIILKIISGGNLPLIWNLSEISTGKWVEMASCRGKDPTLLGSNSAPRLLWILRCWTNILCQRHQILQWSTLMGLRFIPSRNGVCLLFSWTRHTRLWQIKSQNFEARLEKAMQSHPSLRMLSFGIQPCCCEKA